jgi:serine/threonine protein kinase
MAIPPELWREVSAHLDRALDLADPERAVWLEALRHTDPALAPLLEQLLAEHGQLEREHFLENPVLVPNGPRLQGQTLGAYTVREPIGEGGMGSVWLAERSDGRFERRVAIKFLRLSMSARGAAERFAREGKILGQLAHPHIAELIDAGVTPGGEPYLVLEYVAGEPIDEHCDRHILSLDARLQLFLDVLDAVASAHAQLIVHRDIKPSNVLVRNDGQVKLLDFGIAKLLADAQTPAEATLFTLEAGAALTPRFASPEQLSGGQITTATDVYALGVLLYVLLTGRHPAGAPSQSTVQLIKAIVETEPPRLSAAVDSRDEEAARKRHASPDKLQRTLRGDLDLIVGKALKKNPQERYASVSAFGDDLRRYLRHEPISARSDALSYRLRKYVRRHRVGVAIAAVLVLVLAAFSVIQAVELRRITRERDRAGRIADFMTGIFKVSDPGERVGNSVTARQILDKASTDIQTGLSKDPALQAQMMHVMGKAYMMLGLQRQAQSLFEQSIKIGTFSLGPDNAETLSTTKDLSWTLFQQGRLAEAESLQRKLLERDRRILGPEHSDTLGTMGQLATTLCAERNYAEAEALDRQVLAAQKRLLGPDAFDTLVVMDNMSVTLAQEGKLAEAEKLEQETLARQVRVFGYQNLGTISSMINLASIQRDLGKYDQAEKLFHQTLDLEAHVLGPDQPETAETKYDLAALLVRRGRTDEALALIQDAVDHGLHARIDLDIENDPNLKPLHGDPRFALLVAHARKQAASRSAD